MKQIAWIIITTLSIFPFYNIASNGYNYKSKYFCLNNAPDIDASNIEELEEIITHNEYIEDVSVQTTDFSKKAFKRFMSALTTCINIQEFCITNQHINNKMVQSIIHFINKIPNLKTFSLHSWHHSGNDWMIGIIQACAKNPTLTELNFGFATDRHTASYEWLVEICKLLLESNSITSLNLSSDGIDDVGCKLLEIGLKTNQSLCKLTVAANNITDKGAQVLIGAIAQRNSLPTSKIFKLNLTGNPINNEKIDAFNDSLNNPVSLTDINASKKLR